MLKIIIGIAVILFTSFCGYLLSKKYLERKNFYTRLSEFNIRFLSELSYRKRPIKTFLDECEYKGPFREVLEEYKRSLSGEETDFLSFRFLSKEESLFLTDYFSMLGKGDSVSQKNYFTAENARIEQYLKEADLNAKRYGDLYVKLGFLLGLAILILIV